MKFFWSKNQSLKETILQNLDIIILYLIFLIAFIVSLIFVPHFRGRRSLINILNQMPLLGFVALGQTFPIITTGLDLSVGAVMSLTTVIAATLLEPGSFVSVIFVFILVFLVASLVGIINGTIIAKLNVEPLIATLATGSIINGISLLIMSYPGGYTPPVFTDLWLYHVGESVPLSFIYFLIFLAFTFFLLKYNRFGRRIYAVGGDEEKAEISGINVDRVKIKVYLTCSLLAALAGLTLAARMRSGDPTAGEPFTLQSIAAVLVGGTTFTGGKGGIGRTLIGILILSLVRVILNLTGVSPYYQNVLTGVIIILAVIYSSLTRE